MKPLFADIPIDKDVITVLGSGHSIDALTCEDFNTLKENSYIFTMNYAPLRFSGHVNVWSDKKVTQWMEMHYAEHPKKTKMLVRDKAIVNPQSALAELVDFVFSQRADKLKGNYTLVWLLQLLQKYFPKKEVMVFGLDLYFDSPDNVKWYDSLTDFDKRKRGLAPMDRKLKACALQLDRYIHRPEQFLNANPNSNYKGFKTIDWKDFLKQKQSMLND